MAVRIDPENNETRVLFDLADFEEKKVLEIGSGDGRLTWLFADRAAHTIAIEPYAESIAQAREELPAELVGRVDFRNIALEDFAAGSEPAMFDMALLSWSLC